MGMKSGREQLRAWIERQGMTQREAAKSLSMNEVMMSQVLAGDRTPSIQSAIRLEELTGITVRSWKRRQIRKASQAAKPNGAQVADLARR